MDVSRADYLVSNGHVHGYTYWGNEGHVSLDFANGAYRGVLGHGDTTDLVCTAGAGCKGAVDGKPADLTMSVVSSGEEIDGTFNNTAIKIRRTPNDIYVDAANGCKMHVHRHSRRPGHWDGHARYFSGHRHLAEYSVVLETDGSQRDLPDDVLMALTIGAPFTK